MKIFFIFFGFLFGGLKYPPYVCTIKQQKTNIMKTQNDINNYLNLKWAMFNALGQSKANWKYPVIVGTGLAEIYKANRG